MDDPMNRPRNGYMKSEQLVKDPQAPARIREPATAGLLDSLCRHKNRKMPSNYVDVVHLVRAHSNHGLRSVKHGRFHEVPAHARLADSSTLRQNSLLACWLVGLLVC